MKKFQIFLIIFIGTLSCQSPIEKDNSQIKKSIIQKGNLMRDEYSNYKVEVVGAGLPTLLDPNRIKNDSNLVETHEIIRKSETIFNNFNADNAQLVREIRTLLSSLKPTTELSEVEIKNLKWSLRKILNY